MGGTNVTPNPNSNPFAQTLSEIQGNTPSQSAPAQSSTSNDNPFAQTLSEIQGSQPQVTGEVKAPEGYTVITPKPGESFSDTLARARQRWQNMSSDEQQNELSLAQKDIPQKSAESLGGASLAGLVGPAILAAPGELTGAITAGGRALLPALTNGVQAIGEWAEAHPITSKMIYEGIKGAAWYKALKTISK